MPNAALAGTDRPGAATPVQSDSRREPAGPTALPTGQVGPRVLDRQIHPQNTGAVLFKPSKNSGGFYSTSGVAKYALVSTNVAATSNNASTLFKYATTGEILMSPIVQEWPLTWIDSSATTSTTWPQQWLLDNSATTTSNAFAIVSNARTWAAWNNEPHHKAARITQAIARAPLTEEQRRRMAEEEQRRQAEYAERQRRWEIEDAARKAAKEKSDGKAVALLLSGLNEEQRRDLMTKDYFFVKSQKGNLYRIDRGSHRNVRLVDPHTLRVIRTYCAYATDGKGGQAPDGDSMLAQKLMLECMEDYFLKVANAFDHTPPVIATLDRDHFARLVAPAPA